MFWRFHDHFIFEVFPNFSGQWEPCGNTSMSDALMSNALMFNAFFECLMH